MLGGVSFGGNHEDLRPIESLTVSPLLLAQSCFNRYRDSKTFTNILALKEFRIHEDSSHSQT